MPIPTVGLVSDRRTPENDLDRAWQALSSKLGNYNLLWRYYDGDQPLMYTARRMRDLFDDLDMATFVENWCAVVIDSATDRIILESLTTEETKANELLASNWEDLNLPIEVADTHEAALVIGESFIIVWGEDDGNGKDELQVFHNDPRLCHLFYQSGNPRKKWYGAKWWVDNDGYTRLTLYYPDRLEYYRSVKRGQVSSWKSFKPFDPGGGVVMNEDGIITGENPYEEVPFFHFRLERRAVKSDLDNAVPLQNAINKLVTDMMVSAEYGAFKQRWIISNADTEQLKNAPNEVWDIPAGDGEGRSSVGQFDATELENYIKGIDSLASALATISRTPRHYIFGQAGDPSGEALIAMEAPLNKRCNEHIAQFKPVWKDVTQFMLKVQGTEVERKDIIVTFDDPETVQPKAEAEIRQLGRVAGIPLKTLLREEGKDDIWFEQMETDRKEERDASGMISLLDDIRNRRGGDDG